MPSRARSAKLAAEDDGFPTVLLGAFERHNFGDLLFPHVAAALLPGRSLIHAGLAERDLRAWGGHRVEALSQVAAQARGHPVNLIHVGGELLTCAAWQAAVMLLPPDEAYATIARLDAAPAAEKQAWAGRYLDLPDLAPYVVARARFPGIAALCHNAVGGADLEAQDAALRAEVLNKLKGADVVSVRDCQTLATLQTAGVPAQLVPDPGVMVAELFGARILERARAGEVAEVLHAFPQGYIAVQFSADFGDDATLAQIAAQLSEIAASTGYGVVFFRAGAAPWHDELEVYQRAARHMPATSSRLFHGLDLWDICAVIAKSQAYCGSSLHGRIVATAFALPRLTLLHLARQARPGKLAAYATTWEPADQLTLAGIGGVAQGLGCALRGDKARRQVVAAQLVARYREGFDTLRAALK